MIKTRRTPWRILKKTRLYCPTKGAFLVKNTIAFLTGHSVARYVHSLAPLTLLTRAAALRSLAPFTGSLTHFAHSLVGQLKILNMCSRCKRVSQEQTFFIFTRNTPIVWSPDGAAQSDRPTTGSWSSLARCRNSCSPCSPLRSTRPQRRPWVKQCQTFYVTEKSRYYRLVD